jgi:DNA mismatch repair protein MutS
MAQFEIDRQTINDLNLFDDGGISVYSFFNHVKTIGGEKKLRQLMETPSADCNLLDSRKQTIKYFYDRKITLPVNKKDIDFVEHYLFYNRDPLKTNIIDAGINKFRNNFSPTNDYYTITEGIKCVHKLVIILSNFRNNLEIENANLPVTEMMVFIGNFLKKPDIQKIISTDPEKRLGFLKISYYDSLFRKTEIDTLKSLLKIVYEIDAYISISKAIEKHGFCFPEYVDTGECFVKISGLYHPCIENAVSNDVLITADKNMYFLTGANMAGKSSFLKALGLSVYLAHVGFPVPAKNMQTCIFNGLITTINLPDNLMSGYSHYFSEVNRIKQTALKIKQQDRLFVIFDELFRGTNVKDAYDASLATITALSKIKNSVFLVSTHIVEIAAELEVLENIAFKYFDSKIINGKPVFDYQLKTGVSSETLGYFIFKNEGIIELLEQAAKRQ